MQPRIHQRRLQAHRAVAGLDVRAPWNCGRTTYADPSTCSTTHSVSSPRSQARPAGTAQSSAVSNALTKVAARSSVSGAAYVSQASPRSRW